MMEKHIPEGYKQTEVGVIPEDWEIEELGSLIHLQGGYAFKSEKFIQNGVPIVRISDIKDQIKNLSNCVSYEFRNISSEFVVRKGDSLIAMSGATTGKIGRFISKEFAYFNQRVGKFVVKKDGTLDVGFLYYLTGTQQFTTALSKMLATGAQPNISGKQIESIILSIPPKINEQKAIATALSDVDNLITSLEQLIEKKKAIKQGTMQELLTGRRRLEGFGEGKGYKQTELGLIPEDWDTSIVGKFISIRTGKKNTQDRVDEGIYPFFVRSQTIERINSYSYDEEAILTAGDGVGTGKVFHYINGKFECHQRVYILSPTSEFISGLFFFFFFSVNFYNRIIQMTAKTSVDSVRKEMIYEMPIILPTISEQKAIASVLSDMDSDIEKLETRVDKYKQIKQGMMQNLLTGRIRLV